MPRDHVSRVDERGYKRTSFTRVVTASEVGLTDAVDNHKLGVSTEPTAWGRVQFHCEGCTFQIVAEPTISGKVSSRTLATWKRHLEDSSATPNTKINVGTIQRQNKPLQEIFVALLAYAKDNGYPWGKNSTASGWAVYSEAEDRNQILYRTKSKTSAVTQALKHLDMAKRRGSEVAHFDLSNAIPTTDNARGVMSSLLSAEADNVGDKMRLLDSIDEVLLLVPMLQQRRDQLKKEMNASIMELIR